MAQDKLKIGASKFSEVTILDGVSLIDDATQTLTLTGMRSGIIFAKYVTAAGAYYTGTYSLYISNDTLAILILDNSTDFDDADTDAKFDVYSNSGVITLKNRTGATVTAYITALLAE